MDFVLAQNFRINGNPLILVPFIGFFVLIVIWVIIAQVRAGKQREELRQRAEQLGWTYSGKEEWQRAAAASFQIVYSYSGTSNRVPWAMIYSRKLKQAIGYQSATNYDSSRNRNSTTNRFDWRSDAVSVPQMVFLKVRMPKFVNQMMSMISIDADTYVNHLLSLGLTEADNEYLTRMPIVVALLTRSNPLNMQDHVDYGLKQVESFDNPYFELYSTSEEAAAQVMNPQALAALAVWQSYFDQRYGKNAPSHYMMQPMILLYEGGVFLSFESEQVELEAVEAIVEFGTALVNSQK
jgi:hypothetical protein